MKDQQAIKKLQLLKSIQPPKRALASIKKGVYQQVQLGNRTHLYLDIQGKFGNIIPFIRSSNSVFYLGIIAFLLIIFLSISVLLLPNQTHTALLYGKLALAANQYDKARIAFEDTKSRFADNKTTKSNISELAYSLSLTNTQLNELKLKGEKGKYTAQQCHQIYQRYLSYLEEREMIVSSNNTVLKSQLNAYEEQAEQKLHMYKSL